MANDKTEAKKRNVFCGFLAAISRTHEHLKNKSDRDKIYNTLEHLYQDNFRHYYSDIFTTLSMIEDIGRSNDEYSIDILGQNMETLFKEYKTIKYDIEDNLKKLYDHVSLDIARIRYARTQYEQFIGVAEYEKIQEKFDYVKEEYENISDNYEMLNSKQETITDKFNNAQREYVAILGIFAAIALAFTGGLAFSTSVLDNMNNVSKYRLFGVAAIIGIVFINLTYGLVYYVGKIVEKKLTIRPWLLVNALLCSILLLAFIFWCCNHCSAN